MSSWWPRWTRARLTTALRDRDRSTVVALRSVLAALENAEAVPISSTGYAPAVGVGAGDVPRRVLDAVEEREVVDREVAELHAAAEEYDAQGATDRAADLRRAATLVVGIVEA